MPWPQSEAPPLHLERARDREGGSRIAWCIDYWRWECLAQAWWWIKFQKSNKHFSRPKYTKTVKKTGGFTHFWAYNLPKTLFFDQKYLTRYIPETVSEEYINFKMFHDLSHCGVIPVQSLGSHICPRPPRLGLNWICRKKLNILESHAELIQFNVNYVYTFFYSVFY